MADDITPVQEEKEAIVRIAGSRDGLLLHRYLRRVLETVVDLESGGALKQQNGRRSLARDLMRLMAEGIIDGGRADPGNDPILSRRTGPVHVANSGKRDRNQYPRVDSYPDDLNSDGSDPAATDGTNPA